MKLGPVSTPIGHSAKITDINIAVLAKNLDTIDKAGQNLIKMMEQSVQPNLGKHIDFKI